MTKIEIPTGKSGKATLNVNSIMPSMLSVYVAYNDYPKMSATHTLSTAISALNYEPYGTGDTFRVEPEFNGKTIKSFLVWVKYKGKIWFHARYKRNGELLEVLQDSSDKNQSTS